MVMVLAVVAENESSPASTGAAAFLRALNDILAVNIFDVVVCCGWVGYLVQKAPLNVRSRWPREHPWGEKGPPHSDLSYSSKARDNDVSGGDWVSAAVPWTTVQSATERQSTCAL